MSLILFYIAFMIGGALAAHFLGLLVEYEWGPHVSLIVFLAIYFCALWVSWVLAVWVTNRDISHKVQNEKRPPETRGRFRGILSLL